jgi:hypothetical protein
MLLVIQIVTTILSAACAVMIALYATWLLMHRLRRSESKRLAFSEWIRHLFEAVMGL